MSESSSMEGLRASMVPLSIQRWAPNVLIGDLRQAFGQVQDLDDFDRPWWDVHEGGNTREDPHAKRPFNAQVNKRVMIFSKR